MLHIENSPKTRKTVTMMEKAFEATAQTMDTTKPWANTKGPASPVIATLHRLKWKANTYDKWTTDQEVEINLA